MSMRGGDVALRKRNNDIAEASLKSRQEARIKCTECFQVTIISHMEEMRVKSGETAVNVLSGPFTLKLITLIKYRTTRKM